MIGNNCPDRTVIRKKGKNQRAPFINTINGTFFVLFYHFIPVLRD